MIINLIKKAYKAEEVRKVLIKIGKSKMRWEPVGKRKNNLATINIGTDPASGVVERITNAIDAILEKEWKEQGEPEGIRTPRRASELWYDIEDGKLSRIESARDKKIENLSKRIIVTLYESGQNTKPTVEIRDKGIGLEPEQFSKTILDLNGNNKIEKHHLMGAYGQGGSTALSYNNLTLIISKPFFSDQRKTKKVAWTVVRINEGDINKDKHEWYEYMVENSTGQPFTTEISDEEFDLSDVTDHIIADFCTQFGGIENASPIVERQVLEAGLDIENPRKRELVELVNALAGIEEKFKPANIVNMNRTKRLYLVNLF